MVEVIKGTLMKLLSLNIRGMGSGKSHKFYRLRRSKLENKIFF